MSIKHLSKTLAIEFGFHQFFVGDTNAETESFAGTAREEYSMHEGSHSVAKLIYVANTSLDGYVTDENGSIEWTVPDEESIALINELERPIGTHLLGRQAHQGQV